MKKVIVVGSPVIEQIIGPFELVAQAYAYAEKTLGDTPWVVMYIAEPIEKEKA